MTAPFVGIEAVIRKQAGEFPLELQGERDGGAILGKALLILGPEPVEDKTGIFPRPALSGIFAARSGTEIGGPSQGEDIEIEIPGNIPGSGPAGSGVDRDKRHQKQY